MPLLAIGAFALSACASNDIAATTASLPPPSAATVQAQPDYVIGPLDRISISVFQVPELSLDSVQVDAAGQVNLPLVGMMQAGGKTARQLAADVAAQLSKSYLQSPQVSVMVVEANSQKITVEGSVNQPGVFPVTGPTTLLQAIAMARGPDKTADLRKVAIFRTVEGRRAVAVFDLNAIRTGNAPDPAVYGSDIVIVEGSSAKGVWQSVIQAVPLIGVFRFF
jgi:polysaccharide export outer membrane protein